MQILPVHEAALQAMEIPTTMINAAYVRASGILITTGLKPLAPEIPVRVVRYITNALLAERPKAVVMLLQHLTISGVDVM